MWKSHWKSEVVNPLKTFKKNYFEVNCPFKVTEYIGKFCQEHLRNATGKQWPSKEKKNPDNFIKPISTVHLDEGAFQFILNILSTYEC